MSVSDRTYIMIKPDGVQRGLVGEIISRFERRGLKLVAIKVESPSKEHLEKHYSDLASKPFFPSLIKYMTSGPVVAMVWEGRGAASLGRQLLGQTNPTASAPGTIRGDFCIDMGSNLIHGSDSQESAQKEIDLWFPNGVTEYQLDSAKWVYEQ